MMTSHKFYPLVLYPYAIDLIMSDVPPIPKLPNEPILSLSPKPLLKDIPKPTLVLKDKPLQLSLPAPRHPGVFKEKPPKKLLSILKFFLPMLSLSGIVGILIANYLDAMTGFVVTSFIVTLLMIFRMQELKRTQTFKYKIMAHDYEVKDYPKKYRVWKAEQQEIEKKYQQDIMKWQIEIAKEKIKYQQNINDWEMKISNFKGQYEQEIQLWEQRVQFEKKQYKSNYKIWLNKIAELEKLYRSPLKIEEWRITQCKQKLRILKPKSLSDCSKDIRGFAEFADNCKFPILLKDYFSNSKINILKLMGDYTPDFAYIDSDNNLFIDIEIDEPYTPRKYPNSKSELKIVHYLGSDDKRNKYFMNNDWIVVRFSEFQVLKYPYECCYYLAEIIYKLTGDKSILSRFSNDFRLPLDIQWTYEEAKMMASSKWRLNYPNHHFKAGNFISKSVTYTTNSLPMTKRDSARSKTRSANRKKYKAKKFENE